MDGKVQQKPSVLTPVNNTLSPSRSSPLAPKKVSQAKGCQRCRNHGRPVVERPHKCPYKCKTHVSTCQEGCGMVSTRTSLCRTIKLQMAKVATESLIDVVTTEDQPTKPQGRSHYCKKCRIHGKFVRNKTHYKDCEYKQCPCTECEVIERERNLAAKQMKKFRQQVQVEPPIPEAAPTVAPTVFSNNPPTVVPPLPTIPIAPPPPPIQPPIGTAPGGTYMVINMPQLVNVPTLVYVIGPVQNCLPVATDANSTKLPSSGQP